MIDNAYRRLYGLTLDNQVIDCALFALIFSGFLGGGQHENIVIGYIFVSDMAFGVRLLDLFIAGIGAEENNHLRRGELPADDLNNQLKFLAFVFRQMCKGLFHTPPL